MDRRRALAQKRRALLEAALRGPIEASNYYVTRTELHELLARTFESMGDTDSAMVALRRGRAKLGSTGTSRFASAPLHAAAQSAKLKHSESDAPRAGIRQVAQRR